MAIPAAPAPLMTTFSSFNCLPTSFAELINPANTTTAVPCWSSWNTGIPKSCKALSISRQRGALISSRLIPPNTGAILLTVSIIS